MKFKIILLLLAYGAYGEIKASEQFDIGQIVTERMYAHRVTEDSFNNLFVLLSNPQVGAGLLKGTLCADETKEKLLQLYNALENSWLWLLDVL